MNSKIFKWAGLKKKLVMVAILRFFVGYEHDIMH